MRTRRAGFVPGRPTAAASGDFGCEWRAGSRHSANRSPLAEVARVPRSGRTAAYGARVVEPWDPGTVVGPPAPPPPAQAARPAWRRWWPIGAAVLVVVAAVTVTLVLTLGPGAAAPRGARTARSAATGFVAAIDAGDRDRSVALSCDAFTDQAGQFARTGADPGIAFALVSLSPGRGSARAVVVQRLRLAGRTQVQRIALDLTREQGRWLVCGRTQLTR